MSEFECTIIIHHTYDGTPFQVSVNKVGGGTVGESYRSEMWDVTIHNMSDEKVFGTDSSLYLGGEATHVDAAYAAMEFFEAIDERV